MLQSVSVAGVTDSPGVSGTVVNAQSSPRTRNENAAIQGHGAGPSKPNGWDRGAAPLGAHEARRTVRTMCLRPYSFPVAVDLSNRGAHYAPVQVQLSLPNEEFEYSDDSEDEEFVPVRPSKTKSSSERPRIHDQVRPVARDPTASPHCLDIVLNR